MVQSASKDIEFSGELAGMSEQGIIALISVTGLLAAVALLPESE